MAQKISKPAAPYTSPKASENGWKLQFVFDKGNYTWLIVSVAVVFLGFFLMAGTTDIYSSTKIIVAPLTVLTGFGIGFYAILKKPEPKA